MPTPFRVVIALFVLAIALPSAGFAQCERAAGPDGLTWNFEEEGAGFSLGKALGNLFTPQLIKDTRRIRAYVRDPRFGVLLGLCGDMRGVDAIYQKALRIAEYNIPRALFLAMMASLEHQRIDVMVPLVGTFGLPLTFEEDS
ncbi:MAG: hypothetical protein WD295_02345, partial [Bacteroidota bacterium]